MILKENNNDECISLNNKLLLCLSFEGDCARLEFFAYLGLLLNTMTGQGHTREAKSEQE